MDQEEQKNQLPEEAAQEQKQPKGYEAYLSLYDLVRLLAELATGVVSYLALSALFRLEAFREVTTIVRRQLKK
jgi:hypothetical protein